MGKVQETAMKNDESSDHLKQGVKVSATTAAMAGSVSGLVARFVTAPLDILKIRCQISNEKPKITRVLIDIFKNEGIRLFWKGTVPLSYMYVIYGSTQFALYSVANSLLSGVELRPAFHSFVVGSFAGMSSTLLSYPFDLLRTRLASNHTKGFSKLAPTVLQIFRQEGVSGFYKGLKPSLFSVTLQTGLMFQTYEFLKSLVRKNSKQESPLVFITAIDPFIGLISGTVSKIGSFPLDLVRKRLQMQKDTKSSTLEILKQIMKTQGPRGFFNGLSPALLKSGPTSAVSFAVYEYAVTLLTKMST